MHCDACGRPAALCAGCRRPLDPPRFCVRCGRKLRVQVTPTGYVAPCYEHGVVADRRGEGPAAPYGRGAPTTSSRRGPLSAPSAGE